MNGNGLSAGDVLALSRDRNGSAFDWSWIIGLLVVGGLFGGYGNFGGNNGVTQEYIANEFTQRDIFNTNTAVLTGNNNLTRDIMENRFNCSQNANATQREIMQNRYDTSLGLASVDKDILLGNQNLQAQTEKCCCDIKTAIHAEGEETRTMIQNDKIEQLRQQVNASNLALFGQQLVNQILPRSVPAYPSCSPYVPATYGCGCGNSSII